MIDVVTFVPLEQIDPIYYDRTYYVARQETGPKAYRLLADALSSEQLAGISKVAIREKEHLAAVRLNQGRLVLETMHWPEEIRPVQQEEFESRKVDIRDNEVKMARQLVQQLSAVELMRSA